MADGGWAAVVGVALGGLLTAAAALLQNLSHQRFELQRSAQEHRRAIEAAREGREHDEQVRRRQELVEVYTQYQLAADRFENAVRALGSADAAGPAGLEPAQQEYDRACELVRLIGSPPTLDAALAQRGVLNDLAAAALGGRYDDALARARIADVAAPVLESMRRDLSSG